MSRVGSKELPACHGGICLLSLSSHQIRLLFRCSNLRGSLTLSHGRNPYQFLRQTVCTRWKENLPWIMPFNACACNPLPWRLLASCSRIQNWPLVTRVHRNTRLTRVVLCPLEGCIATLEDRRPQFSNRRGLFEDFVLRRLVQCPPPGKAPLRAISSPFCNRLFTYSKIGQGQFYIPLSEFGDACSNFQL